MAFTIIAVLVLIVGGWLGATFNRLVKLRNLKDEGWSGIDVQLKRRYDLIPNIVSAVKGYSVHERSTFERIAVVRASVANAGDNTKERIEAENELSSTLKSLLAVAENYPELKANTNFLQLQEQLSKIEEELQISRRYYNGTVRNLNTTIQSFPANLVAVKLGFKTAPFFEAEEGAKASPAVQF